MIALRNKSDLRHSSQDMGVLVINQTVFFRLDLDIEVQKFCSLNKNCKKEILKYNKLPIYTYYYEPFNVICI